MELPAQSSGNFMVWAHHPCGHFPSKTAYACLLQQHSNTPRSLREENIKAFKILWNLLILPKWKFFIWLPTKEQLVKRRMPVTHSYDICHQELETLQHFFQDCPIAQSTWQQVNFHFSELTW